MSDYFQVEFSEPFEADLDVCYLRLSQFPRRCPLAPEAQSFGQEVRLLIYHHRHTAYRILYTIFDATEDVSGTVRILRVRQGARQEETEDGF